MMMTAFYVKWQVRTQIDLLWQSSPSISLTRQLPQTTMICWWTQEIWWRWSLLEMTDQGGPILSGCGCTSAWQDCKIPWFCARKNSSETWPNLPKCLVCQGVYTCSKTWLSIYTQFMLCKSLPQTEYKIIVQLCHYQLHSKSGNWLQNFIFTRNLVLGPCCIPIFWILFENVYIHTHYWVTN